jgi:hypothetical protein
MSLGWVIAGTFAQLMLAMMLMMWAVFAGGGLANGRPLTPGQTRVLDLSMLLLPLSAVVSAGIVIYLYVVDASATAYWWYALPLAAFAMYCVFVASITRRRGA